MQAKLQSIQTQKFRMIASAVCLGLIGLAGAVMGGRAHAATVTPSFSGFGADTRQMVRDGDFDGDGRTDSLYMVTEPETGRVAVHIRFNDASGARDVRVTSLEVAPGARPEVQVVHAGHFAPDCGDYASDCGTGVDTTHDGLILSMNSANVLVYWQNGRFEQDFVRSDEALMAQAFASLYASNP